MIAFFLGAVACIILAGVNFNFSNVNFNTTTSSFKNMGGLEIAAIIYVFATCLVGMFSFWCMNKCVIFIVIIT